MTPSVRWLNERDEIPILVVPNAGMPLNEGGSFFYYTVRDGNFYPDVIRMLQAIDLKSEKLNPMHDLHDEQHRSEMSNFTSV